MGNMFLAVQFLILCCTFLYIVMKYNRLVESINRTNSNMLEHYLRCTRENKEIIENLRSEINQKFSINENTKKRTII